MAAVRVSLVINRLTKPIAENKAPIRMRREKDFMFILMKEKATLQRLN